MLTQNPDSLVGIANWSSIEFAMAVVSASLPTLRPLVNKLTPASWKRMNTPANRTTGSGSRRFHLGRESIKLNKPKGASHSLHDDGNEAYTLRNEWADPEFRELDHYLEIDMPITRDFDVDARRACSPEP